MSLLRGPPEAACRESPVALPPPELQRLLLPPHHGDDVKANGLPAAADQQRELQGIFPQVFSADVTWMQRVWQQ